MRGDTIAGRVCGSRHKKDRLNRPSIGLGREVPPLPSGIDSERSMPKMKSIAVEAFGRHLKGADASVPFSFGGFSEIPENPGVGSGLYRFYIP